MNKNIIILYKMTSLTPLYGLGSYGRIVGATAISCPRSRIGSSGRVYDYLKKRIGQQGALAYFQRATFGPFIIRDRRLVWN